MVGLHTSGSATTRSDDSSIVTARMNGIGRFAVRPELHNQPRRAPPAPAVRQPPVTRSSQRLSQAAFAGPGAV